MPRRLGSNQHRCTFCVVYLEGVAPSSLSAFKRYNAAALLGGAHPCCKWRRLRGELRSEKRRRELHLDKHGKCCMQVALWTSAVKLYPNDEINGSKTAVSRCSGTPFKM